MRARRLPEHHIYIFPWSLNPNPSATVNESVRIVISPGYGT